MNDLIKNFFDCIQEYNKATQCDLPSECFSRQYFENFGKKLINGNLVFIIGQRRSEESCFTFGQNNMLDVAFLGEHLLRMCSYKDLELVYDMITTKAVEAINISNYELKVGGNADLVNIT